MVTILLLGLSGVCSIVSLVCFIMVIVQMFKRDESKMGIVCIVTFLCCGIGGLIAFVYGWTKAAAWDIKNIMIAWSVAIMIVAIMIVAIVIVAVKTLATIDSTSPYFNTDPDTMNFEIDMGDGAFEFPEGATEPEVTPTEQP